MSRTCSFEFIDKALDSAENRHMLANFDAETIEKVKWDLDKLELMGMYGKEVAETHEFSIYLRIPGWKGKGILERLEPFYVKNVLDNDELFGADKVKDSRGKTEQLLADPDAVKIL